MGGDPYAVVSQSGRIAVAGNSNPIDRLVVMGPRLRGDDIE